MPRITKKHPSALPIYLAAAIWIVYSLIRPMYNLADILICAVLSVLAWLAGKKLFPARIEEIDMPEDTGNAQLNAQIQTAREQLAKVRACNEQLPGEIISQRLTRIEVTGLDILALVTRQPEKANQLRRFFHYYLPTTLKLLDAYIRMEGTTGENAQNIQKNVENSLDMIANAFASLYNQLLTTNALDITSEIQAMETIFAAEGLDVSNREV